MGKLIDLTGMQFDRLRVERRAGTYVSEEDGHKAPTWLCTCECGNQVVVIGGNLRSGKTTSCGCLRKEVSARPHQRRPKGSGRKANTYSERWFM